MNLGILCMCFICNIWRLWFLLVYLVILVNLMIPLNLVKLVSMVTLVNLVTLEIVHLSLSLTASAFQSVYQLFISHFCHSRERRAIINDTYFCAADYLRLPKFSLTNSCIFRENTQFFTKIVVVGSGDRTTSEESWLHP